jgi:uncharacterized protein (TIGR00288 family)
MADVIAPATSNLAVFFDYENVALGARDAKYGEFDVQLVLERLLDKGKIVVKKAYCDWSRYEKAKRPLHEAAFELIEIPHVSYSGKNSADIRMVVDALDLCYTKGHVDVFVVVTGDSDFSPLVNKLRENGKAVIGMGVKSSTSQLLIENCDEFIYYDDLVRAIEAPPASKEKKTPAPKKRQEAADQLLNIVRSLERDYDPVWGSMVKQATRRVYPGFNEEYYGYASFAELLEDLAEQGVLELEYDERRGNYTVRTRRS